MSGPRVDLPNELWLMVTKELGKDIRTLRALSEVDRQIRPLVIPTIFQRMTIEIGSEQQETYTKRSPKAKPAAILREIQEGKFPYLTQFVKKLDLVGFQELFHKDFLNCFESSHTPLLNIFPNLTKLGLGSLRLDETSKSDILTAIFGSVCSHDGKPAVTLSIAHRNKIGDDDHPETDTQSLELLRGLHSFSFHSTLLHPPSDLVNRVADILFRSPDLKSLKLSFASHANLKIEHFLSKFPANLAFPNLKNLILAGVVPPSTSVQLIMFPVLEDLQIDTCLNIAIQDTKSMWPNMCQLGLGLKSLTIDYPSHELCDYLVSNVASNTLKTLKILLPYGSTELRDNYPAYERISENLWQDTLPQIFRYLESFTLIYNDVLANGFTEGPTFHQWRVFTANWDTLIWSIQKLAPHIDQIAVPTKLKNIKLMITLDENDKSREWASETVKVLQAIMRNNINNLSADLYLMTQSSTVEEFIDQKFDDKMEMRRLLNDFPLKDGKGSPFFRFRTRSLFCAKDHDAIRDFLRYSAMQSNP